MCTHEESNPATAEALSAWRIIDSPEGPMQHFYHASSTIVVLRLAIEALQEHFFGADLCHLYAVCQGLEKEMHEGVRGLEDALSEVQVGH